MSDLSAKMIKDIERYFPDMGADALKGYTSETLHSDYRGAQSDLKIYDAEGKVVFLGRHFASTGTAFWRPTRLATTPEFVSTEATVVPSRS